MRIDLDRSPRIIERPTLARWMFERGLRPKDAIGALGVSGESIRRYCLPFGHADRQVPTEPVMLRIRDWTSGAITPADFYPPHLNAAREACPAPEPAE